MKNYKEYLIVLVLCLTVLSRYNLLDLKNSHPDDGVRITSLGTNESQIISHILRLLTEHNTKGEIKPTLISSLGSSATQHNAAISGQANMSGTRYTDTDLTEVLKENPIKNPKKVMEAAQERFRKKYNQTFFNSYGFENTYALIVIKETTRKCHLEAVSGLEKHTKDLRVGMGSSWMGCKGGDYPAFKEEYGCGFGTVKPMQIDLVYDALNSDKLDVAVGCSTDGRISAYDLKVLGDDRRFSPPYDTNPPISDQLLKEKPELEPIVKKLRGKISTKQMQESDYQADGRGKEPATVTEDFLKKHHYFEDDDNKKDKQKGGQ